MSQALNLHYLRPWSDVAVPSRANVLRVFQRCWKTSRDFTDMPQSDTDNIRLAAMTTALTSMYSWLFPTNSVASHFWNWPIMWTAQIEYLLLFSLFPSPASHASSSPFKCWPLELKQPGKIFSSQHVNSIESKGLRMIKDSNTELYWVSEQKRKDSLAARIELSEHQSAATACLHVDINLKESRLRPRYPWEAIR